MKTSEFKQWLEKVEPGKATKLYTDCASRAQRVEKAFQKVNPSFSFDSEYKKDKGENFKYLFSRRGIAIKDPVELPLGTNQMDSIASAVKKYFRYLDSEK